MNQNYIPGEYIPVTENTELSTPEKPKRVYVLEINNRTTHYFIGGHIQFDPQNNNLINNGTRMEIPSGHKILVLMPETERPVARLMVT